jgi:tetratricopeptide (TPR) repeat protein
LYFEIRDYQKSYEYLSIAYKYFIEAGYFPQKYEASSLLGITCYYLEKYYEAFEYFKFLLTDPWKDPIVELLIEIIQQMIQ